MSPLLIALLGVLLVPFFVSTWRANLVGLLFQGVLLAWISWRLGFHVRSLDSWITMLDLVLVRTILAPAALYSVLRHEENPARAALKPPNLLAWTVAFGLVLVAFTFAEVLTPNAGDDRTLVAVAASALLLGFLVLATQSGSFAEVIGALRIENAIALFELGGAHHESLWLRLGQTAIFVATLFAFRWFLAHAPPTDRPVAAAPREEATF